MAKEIMILPGGLMRMGRTKYIAKRYNIRAAKAWLDNGQPRTVEQWARLFNNNASKAGCKEARRQIRQLVKHQFYTQRPVIGTYSTDADGNPLLNGKLLSIRLFTGRGSAEEAQELNALRKKKQYFGNKLLKEAERLIGLQEHLEDGSSNDK